jgi:Zn-dependent protease
MIALSSIISGPIGIYYAFAIFLSVIIHEYAHAIAASSRGFTTSGITIHGFGGMANITGLATANQRDVAIIALAGPLANAVVAGIMLPMTTIVLNTGLTTLYTICNILLLSNIYMAIVNMAPVYPLDGGKALSALLKIHFGYYKSEQITQRICAIFLIAMWIVTLSHLHSLIETTILLSIIGIISLSLNKKKDIDYSKVD